MRKAQIVGAAAGALVTIIPTLCVICFDRNSDWFDYPISFWLLLTVPLGAIVRIFGGTLQNGPEWLTVLLMVVTNAFLLFMAGTIIGWLVERVKRTRNHNS